MSSSDPEKVVVLARVPTEPIASLLVGRLRDEGIQAEMSGVLTSAFRAEAPGDVKILVHARDLERARELLEGWKDGGS